MLEGSAHDHLPGSKSPCRTQDSSLGLWEHQTDSDERHMCLGAPGPKGQPVGMEGKAESVGVTVEYGYRVVTQCPGDEGSEAEGEGGRQAGQPM